MPGIGDDDTLLDVLPLPRGNAYHSMLFCLVLSGAFWVFVALVGGDAFVLTFVGLLVAVSGIGFAYYRLPRRILANRRGITLEVGKRSKHLAWETVKSVRYGSAQSTIWVYVPVMADELLVRGKVPWNRISVHSELYALPPHALRRFAEVVAGLAREKSIPISEVTPRSALSNRRSLV